jgi:hypothetical protein
MSLEYWRDCEYGLADVSVTVAFFIGLVCVGWRFDVVLSCAALSCVALWSVVVCSGVE